MQMPEFQVIYTAESKKQKEIYLDQLLKSIKSNGYLRSARPISEPETQSFINQIRDFFVHGLDYTQEQLQLMFSDELFELTRQFVAKSKAFDPQLTFTDIFQACRNIWIMNGIQIILGLPVKLTPSLFAYSLLYPYTDNLIDNPDVSSIQKLNFSNRFFDRLSGIEILPENNSEEKIFSLVSLIELEYPRLKFPEVYESLLGIHQAQTQSLKLFQSADSMSDSEALEIAIAKGGSSVLADGYLVAGRLSEEQKYFLYGYGAYLQLLDDVQDVEEDRRDGVMTVFSKTGHSVYLDTKLNKTYWFGRYVMESLQEEGIQHHAVFHSLMQKSLDLFIIEAIGMNQDYFSKTYVMKNELFSPFKYSFLQKRKTQLEPHHGMLLTALESIARAEFESEKQAYA